MHAFSEVSPFEFSEALPELTAQRIAAQGCILRVCPKELYEP